MRKSEVIEAMFKENQRSEIQRLAKYWKHELGLDDWLIDVRPETPSNEMTLGAVEGETEWQEVNKCAVIKLLIDCDYGDRIAPYDKERVLVHELLHCKFAMLDHSGDDLRDRLIHQMIEDMAKALVSARRYGEKESSKKSNKADKKR